MSTPQVHVVIAGEQHDRAIDETTTWGDVLADFVPGLRGVVPARELT